MGLTDNSGEKSLGRLGPVGRGGPIIVEHLPKPKNSAGRDLPTAIGVGVFLGALVIACLWIGPIAWFPLLSVAGFLAMWETMARMRENSIALPRWVMLALGQLIIWVSWPYGAKGTLGAIAFSAVTVMFARLFHHGRTSTPQNYMRDSAIGFFVLAWIPLCLAFAGMLILFEHAGVSGGFYVATFMLCVVGSDIGGYAAGVMFGSHPMAPAISPHKSWEGAAGSMIAGIIMGVLTTLFLINDPHWSTGIVLGAVLVVCAILGDLVESQVKRDLHIKDMSHLLPGHGGLMDRIDGMLPSAAMSWIVLSALGS